MAVLFIGVGIYVNNSYASAIHASIVEENTNRLSALRLQHEEKLSALINIANQISLSPYLYNTVQTERKRTKSILS